VAPLKENLKEKKQRMQVAVDAYTLAVDYGVEEVTTASVFWLAEIYSEFGRDLMASERPAGLSEEELQQYDILLEEQAYPFEEKAIAVHESNLKLMSRGVYNGWVEKSLEKLAEVMPARYDKTEETSGIISSLETYVYEIDRPAPPAPPESEPEAPLQVEEPETVAGPEPAEPVQVETAVTVTEPKPSEPVRVEEAGSVTESEPSEPVKVETAGSVTESEPSEPVEVEAAGSATEPEPEAPVKVE